MGNSIVSVRIPKSLFTELSRIVERKHFLDVSELVRSLVRRKWLEHHEPQQYQLKRLREDITQLVKDKTKKKEQEELIADLEKLKFLLKEKEGGKHKG